MSINIQQDPPIGDEKKQAQSDAHRDPLSGRAGAHPIGTGVGAAAGGIATSMVAGAVIGTVAGPIGTSVGAAIGAVAGAVAGGMAGKTMAEHIDPTVEHGYWRQHYTSRPYISANAPYEQYAPAYQHGWESRARHVGQSFEQAESTMRQDWHKVQGSSRLHWDQAKEAVRDAWNRVANAAKNPDA